MLIRVLVVVLVAVPLAIVLAVAAAFAGDISAKEQLKLQDANNVFTRPLERPAPQRDLRDQLSNQDKVRSFSTKRN